MLEIQVRQEADNKKSFLTNYKTDVRPEEILAIGDTAGDLPILQEVGYPACPGNASEEVKELIREKGGYVGQAEFAWGVVEILKHYKLLKEE